MGVLTLPSRREGWLVPSYCQSSVGQPVIVQMKRRVVVPLHHQLCISQPLSLSLASRLAVSQSLSLCLASRLAVSQPLSLCLASRLAVSQPLSLCLASRLAVSQSLPRWRAEWYFRINSCASVSQSAIVQMKRRMVLASFRHTCIGSQQDCPDEENGQLSTDQSVNQPVCHELRFMVDQIELIHIHFISIRLEVCLISKHFV